MYTIPEWTENESGECAGVGLGGDAGAGCVGVVMGGRARGWLPDVAAVLWRRMLAALGDPNHLKDPHAHHHLYNYLIHLNATLLKVRSIFFRRHVFYSHHVSLPCTAILLVLFTSSLYYPLWRHVGIKAFIS